MRHKLNNLLENYHRKIKGMRINHQLRHSIEEEKYRIKHHQCRWNVPIHCNGYTNNQRWQLDGLKSYWGEWYTTDQTVSKKQKGLLNPYQTPDRTNVQNSPVPPKSVDGATSVASASTAVVKEKNVRTIAWYKIFFSTRNYNKDTSTYNLTLGEISEDFMEALEASSKTELITKFKTALITRVLKKQPVNHTWIGA